MYKLFLPEGISFSSQSMNISVLEKVLILRTQIFLSFVLRNNYSLNAPIFGLTRAKYAEPKNMEYNIILTDLHFDSMQFVYILNKRPQIKDSTLQNGILGQSKKNTNIFRFSFEWLKKD